MHIKKFVIDISTCLKKLLNNMWIFSLYVLSFLLFLASLKGKIYDKKAEICFLSFVVAAFVLIATFRDYSSYPDFIGFSGYENRYVIFGNKSFESIWSFRNELKDITYYFLGSFMCKIGISFRGWITIIAAFDLLAILLHVKKYSNNYGLSFLMFLSLGYYFFMLCGLRQAIALALVLFAYDAGKKHRFRSFCILVFLAYLFHQSAIVFLPFYFIIAKKKIEKKHIWILLFLIVITLLNYKSFMSLLAFQAFEDNNRYARFIDSNREGLNATNIIIYASMYAYCLIARRHDSEDQQEGILVNKLILDTRKECLLLIPIGCFFRALSMYSPESFRLAMYFDIFLISYFSENTIILHKDGLSLKSFITSSVFFAYFLFFSSRSFFVFA